MSKGANTWQPFWRPAKNRWILPYIDAAGKQRQHVIPPEHARTERHDKEAQTYARDWLAKQSTATTSAETATTQPADAPTIRALCEGWVKLRRCAKVDGKARYAPSTIAGYEEQLATRILKPQTGEQEAIGDVPLNRLDPQRVRLWVRGLAGAVSPLRARNCYATARSLVDDAMAEGWVTLASNPFTQPAALRELPAAKRKTGVRPIVVELEHMQRVLACHAVPEHRRVRYLVDACSGLSEGELAGRVWADVDLGEHPSLNVLTSLATQGPDGWASMGTTKNEHRVRKIPLHSAAAEALRWWKAEGWADYVGRHPKATDPIFPGPEGNFTRPASAELLRRDLRAAGCPDKCNGHPVTAQALRRCFSSWLDAAGVSEEVRGRLMGHAAKSVTAKHYTAAAMERDRIEVEKIALRWTPPHAEQHVARNAGNGSPERHENAAQPAEPAPIAASSVPRYVPGHVPAAHESELSAEPPSRFELETYGLRKRIGHVPETAYEQSRAAETVSGATGTNGVTGTNGNANVPEGLAACAGHMSVMAGWWAAMEATVAGWGDE